MSFFYDSGGVRLSFRDQGAGIPIIFLHPTPLDHFYWLPMVAKLGTGRAVLPDLRGHGSSELGADLPVGGFANVPDAPVLSMAQLATDVLALMDYLKVTGAVFAGCSIGGYVLLELWRKVPERMRGLIIVCAKPQPDAPANYVKRATSIAQARRGDSAALFDGMAQSLIGLSARERRPEIVQELRARMTLSPDAVVAVQAGLATRPDSMPTIATIDVPVLAICGGEDPGITPVEMETFNAAPGGCEFYLLPNAGHFAAYEEPQRIAVLVGEWLKRFDA
jgi:3-oxoadipate enol-lactonase